MLGSYGRAKPHEPEIYAAAIAAVLADYPAEVVQAVTDVRCKTSLPRTLKWLPEPAEVAEACETAMVGLRKADWMTHKAEQARIEDERERERQRRLQLSAPILEAKIAAWRKEAFKAGSGPIERLAVSLIGSDPSAKPVTTTEAA
jgi:hypothetical protein